MSRKQIRKVELSAETQKEIQQRIRQTKARKIADRLRVVLLKAEGYKNHMIAHILQLSINTVGTYIRTYLREGIDVLCETHYKGKPPRLTPEQEAALSIELRTHLYYTAGQVIRWVAQEFNVTYQTRGMHKLLKRLGFSYKKNRLIPSQADPEAQRQFVHWFTKLRAELGPDDRIYFLDAVHVHHNAEAGYTWSPIGNPHLIPTNSGRQRYNILGAYCTQTHEHTFILTPTNINQVSIVSLLYQLRGQHPDQRVWYSVLPPTKYAALAIFGLPWDVTVPELPVPTTTEAKLYVVLDNASYNHAHWVRDQAQASSIALHFQPPYSPSLNLIERLWKFMRHECCQDKYESTFAAFCAKLDTFFAQLDQHREALATLLTENFEQIPSSWQALPPA